MTASKRLLVADIGGTHARFAIAVRRGGAVSILCKQSFETRDYKNVDDAAETFLASAKPDPVDAAIFAVAAPVTSDEIIFTNSPWRFSRPKLAARLGCKSLEVVNDFAASARGAVEASGEGVVAIKRGDSADGAPIAVLGPGTGLGLGLVLRDEGRVQVLPTQGGHAAFAPANEVESEVLRYMRRDHSFVSFEEVLSGRGLANLHRAHCWLADTRHGALSPEEVTIAALNRKLATAQAATRMFCAILGTFAGDAALMTGARGGVILAGGILPRIEPILRKSEFVARFETRDSMSDYMRAIPVSLLKHEDAALIGAALLAQ
jgi:glucokinase